MKKLVMAVLVVFAVLAAIPATRARMMDAASPTIVRYQTGSVSRQLEMMADQLDARLGMGQQLPTNWEAWLRRDFTGKAEDPWGNPYFIDTRRRGVYVVGSVGPDGERRTDDDITEQREIGG